MLGKCFENCAAIGMVPSENGGNRCECPRGFHFELDNSKLDLNIEKLRNIPKNRLLSSTTGTANTAGTGKSATETANTAATGKAATETANTAGTGKSATETANTAGTGKAATETYPTTTAPGDLLDQLPGGCVINSCPEHEEFVKDDGPEFPGRCKRKCKTAEWRLPDNTCTRTCDITQGMRPDGRNCVCIMATDEYFVMPFDLTAISGAIGGNIDSKTGT